MRKTHDVFLSHNSADKPAVEKIARNLIREKIKPWFDAWDLVAGEPWQEALERGLAVSCTCAVFWGRNQAGPWENEEMRSALDERVNRKGYRVIPVILPGARQPDIESLPPFLRRLTWVNFKYGIDDKYAMRALIAGIRGKPNPSRPRTTKPKKMTIAPSTMRLVQQTPSQGSSKPRSKSDLQRDLVRAVSQLEKAVNSLDGHEINPTTTRPVQYLIVQISSLILEVKREILDKLQPDDPRSLDLAEHWGETQNMFRSFVRCLDETALGESSLEQLGKKVDETSRSLRDLSSGLNRIRF